MKYIAYFIPLEIPLRYQSLNLFRISILPDWIEVLAVTRVVYIILVAILLTFCVHLCRSGQSYLHTNGSVPTISIGRCRSVLHKSKSAFTVCDLDERQTSSGALPD